jgi:hypothetical protein
MFKFLLPLCLILPFSKAISDVEPKTCLSTREFITTLTYLREHKSFSLPEKSIRELSEKIATGCTGASKRFIEVTDLLVKAGYPSAKSIQLAQRFASGTDKESEAFQSVFKSSFVKELLDLSLQEAIDIAMILSLDYDGDPSVAQAEFEKIIKFCTADSSLGLPLLACGKLATRVVRSGGSHSFKVGEEFVDLFRYLGKKDFVTKDALAISEDVVAQGPTASENFKRAYEFALEKDGLGLGRKEARAFALNMAHLSISKIKKTK